MLWAGKADEQAFHCKTCKMKIFLFVFNMECYFRSQISNALDLHILNGTMQFNYAIAIDLNFSCIFELSETQIYQLTGI